MTESKPVQAAVSVTEVTNVEVCSDFVEKSSKRTSHELCRKPEHKVRVRQIISRNIQPRIISQKLASGTEIPFSGPLAQRRTAGGDPSAPKTGHVITQDAQLESAPFRALVLE